MAKKKKENNEIKVVRSPDHKSHYVIGAIPQWTEDDLRLHLYNEIIEGPNGPYYVSTSQIILPKSALSRLMDALRNAMKEQGAISRSEVMNYPPEIYRAIEKDQYERHPQKKKVQKIRRK